jgi:hypothetical protein
MADEKKLCVFCQNPVDPSQLLKDLNDSLNESQPLLNTSIRSQATSTKYSNLRWMKNYVADWARGCMVYYHCYDKDNPNEVLYYCSLCGPRVNASYFNRGEAVKFDENTSLNTSSISGRRPSSPGQQWTPSEKQWVEGSDSASSSPPSTPPAGRGAAPLPLNINSKLKQRTPPRKTTATPDSPSIFSRDIDISILVLGNKAKEFNLTAELKQADFDGRLKKKVSTTGIFHWLLCLLSAEYKKIAKQAYDRKISLRQHYVADQGWLPWLGLKTYARSQKIIKEIKAKIANTKDELDYDLPIITLSPMVWSMQFITARGIELSMADVDKTWSSTLMPYQRWRAPFGIMLVLAFAVVATKLAAAETAKNNNAGPPPPAPTPTPTPTPTSAWPTPTQTSTSARPTSTPTSTSARPTPTPTSALPTSTQTSTSARPTSTPTSTSARPTPTPTPTPGQPNCDFPEGCEGNHWQTLRDILEYNYNLPQPIKTTGALRNACGEHAHNLFNQIIKCYPDDQPLIDMINSATTDLIVLANKLAQKDINY